MTELEASGQMCPHKVGRLIACLLLVAMLTFGLSACSKEADALVVSYAPFESTALVWIAEDRGFFEDNGLDLTFHKYDTGAAALDAVLSGEADIAVGPAEFPVVGKALRKEPSRVVATIARSELIFVVGRKDRGIEGIADLKGKRVGTTFGTIAEYFLGRSLELRGLSGSDVTLVDLKTPLDWVNAVQRGDVDAVCTAEPYASSAADGLGANAAVWSAHDGQLLNGLAVTSEAWLGEHAELLPRFLRSLDQAGDYAAQNAVSAQAIVQNRLEMTDADVEKAWHRSDFRLSLDESLIAAMEGEARWMIRGGLTTETDVPDFLNYVYEEGLAAVAPETVNIIR